MAKVTVNANQLSSPAWAGDDLGGENLMPGGAKIVASQFNAPDAVVVVVGAAGALANATSVPVDALAGPIPSGTLLDFGAKKFARLSSAAAAGATSLAVDAIPTALVDDDTATYPGTQKKNIPAGTLLGRTYTERDANTGFGPAADADEEFYLLAFDIEDAELGNDAELYRHGRLVFENYLPVFSTLSSTLKAKIRALYEVTKATN